MRGGFTFSLGVHVLLLALLIFGLPFLRPKPPELTPTISVDVIDMAKEATTNKISPANKVEKTPEPETPPPKPPPPREQLAPQLAAVEPSAAPAQEVQVPDVVLKKQLKTVVPDVDSTQPKIAEIEVPKVELKKKQPPKPPAPNFDSVLKNLSKLKPKDTPTQQPPQPTQVASKPPAGALAPLSAKLTASEMGALQQQLAQCWNIPAGSKDARNLVVELDVEVGPDRVVTRAEIVDQGRLATDPIYRAAAMSAKRALSMPQCTPLALPPEKYDEWKSMTLRFDPKEMLG